MVEKLYSQGAEFIIGWKDTMSKILTIGEAMGLLIATETGSLEQVE